MMDSDECSVLHLHSTLVYSIEACRKRNRSVRKHSELFDGGSRVGVCSGEDVAATGYSLGGETRPLEIRGVAASGSSLGGETRPLEISGEGSTSAP